MPTLGVVDVTSSSLSWTVTAAFNRGVLSVDDRATSVVDRGAKSDDVDKPKHAKQHVLRSDIGEF